MHIIKIRSQFNAVFLLIMLLALLSFFTARYFVNNVSTSYENIMKKSLPVIRKSGELAQIAAQIESQLIHVHLEFNNDSNIRFFKRFGNRHIR